MKNLIKIGAAIICLAAFTNASLAAKPGFYLGAGVGGSKLDTPNKYSYEFLPSADAAGMSQSGKSTGLAGRGFAGFNFNEYFGIEGGFAKYADSTYNGNLHNVYKSSVNYAYNALDLVGKAYLPLGSTSFNLYALGGVAYVNSKVTYKETVSGITMSEGTGSVTTKKFRPIYGLGASYDIPQTNFTTNIEYSHIQGSGNVKTSTSAIPSADLVTLNFNYNFG